MGTEAHYTGEIDVDGFVRVVHITSRVAIRDVSEDNAFIFNADGLDRSRLSVYALGHETGALLELHNQPLENDSDVSVLAVDGDAVMSICSRIMSAFF